MTLPENDDASKVPAPSAPEVTEADDIVLRDLESKYAGVICPIHGVAPAFEVDEKGAVVETICCEVLLRIFRELEDGEQAADAEAAPPASPEERST